MLKLFKCVFAAYMITVAYEKLGETEKAREYYDFAAKNGGDTCFASAAKEKLK